VTDAKTLIDKRTAARQRQFLDIVDAEQATRQFHHHLKLTPSGVVQVPLECALGRVLAEDMVAGVNVPGFDRTNVDGFAIRASDSVAASEDAQKTLMLNDEVLTPGAEPRQVVETGTATLVSTGAIIPRGADAVVMVEDTDLVKTAEDLRIALRRPVAAGAHITFAGTDIGMGETVLRAGQQLTSREIGLVAAIGHARVPVFKRPRVAVISTGDEIMAPGTAPREGGIYDSNQYIVGAAVEELGAEAVYFGAVADERGALDDVIARALDCDMVILSGGTSKGAGDICYEAVSALPSPGIVVHGVAIKPGKPLCLAVTGSTPVVILPGFPTSAIFTFHHFVAPVIRAFSGTPETGRTSVRATLATRVRSDPGRMEFALVNLVTTGNDYSAYPIGKGSGAVSAFSQADGFFNIDAGREQVSAGTQVDVQLISSRQVAADFIAIGSHCVGLDYLLGEVQRGGFTTKAMHVGSNGGLAAAQRGECDIAAIHLMDSASGEYNRPFLSQGLDLVTGYRRLQGVVHRLDDTRFAHCESASAAVAIARDDARCIMVNRNAGSGTRILIDELLEGDHPPGYAHQVKSHNAVVAAIAQGRADWGVAIDTVARSVGLGFISLQEEQYDFVVPASRRERPAVRYFTELLAKEEVRRKLSSLGFRCE
jgi:putative molybdopterin biosynthesis protein